MNLTFTGGAREVGASCYLLEIDGKNILLDCGIRMKGSDSLPDFRLIQENGGIDAVIISHAHLDHSGSLPVISREYPGARICMTHASKALIQVLLYDSLKIMERGDEIPIYAEKHVQEMLDRIICYSPQFSFKPIPESDIKVTFYNAGHIAGAALVYIEGEEGTLLYTGDFSATDQQSVIGGSVPKLRPDVMISESTYGDKLHSNRENEEKRLVDTVREVMNREGKMLIPAFALGRAQEIILILRKAMNKNQLPEFNIYVDGMVRDINRIYKSYPNYLKSNLADKIFRGNDIFYNDNVIEIEDREMREKVAAADGPYCIVSSSGMLKGGPSCFYAETVAEAEKNFIAITGYQDEETPGSDVLELLEEEPEERELEINNNTVDLNCEVGEYGLSAHADKGELTGLVHRVTPRKLFLLHGNQKTIQELAVDLNQEIFTEIYVPANGETFTADFNNPRKQLDYTNNLDPLSSGEKLNENNIEELWQYILRKDRDRYRLFYRRIDIYSGRKRKLL